MSSKLMKTPLLNTADYRKIGLVEVILITLVVIVLNTRSLKRHAKDMNRARQLTDNYILCLTESQITNDTDVKDLLKQLSTFKIYFNSCGVRQQNLAFCLGQNVFLSIHDTSLGIYVTDITKDSF